MGREYNGCAKDFYARDCSPRFILHYHKPEQCSAGSGGLGVEGEKEPKGTGVKRVSHYPLI